MPISKTIFSNAFLMSLAAANIVISTVFDTNLMTSASKEMFVAFFVFGLCGAITFLGKWRGLVFTLLLFSAAYDLLMSFTANFWVDRVLNDPKYEEILGPDGVDTGSIPILVYKILFWITVLILSCKKTTYQ